eukprot:snap_masked-scaffold_88-processed-gene-0.36-mRNA-1 protein AED:1.00 eAED:1.00 QI:0/-1/0/0/-1/1/1/0/100
MVQLNISNAFVSVYVNKTNYFELQQKEKYKRKNCVWSTKKSICELKQSSRAWYLDLDMTLGPMGLEYCIVEMTMYRLADDSGASTCFLILSMIFYVILKT